ncbi:hypothetical protein J6590_000250 [Homalodisca vitripennis]|nr:hypothetical protein J6590_000250 [Homalodisca vitripennis]
MKSPVLSNEAAGVYLGYIAGGCEGGRELGTGAAEPVSRPANQTGLVTCFLPPYNPPPTRSVALFVLCLGAIALHHCLQISHLLGRQTCDRNCHSRLYHMTQT